MNAALLNKWLTRLPGNRLGTLTRAAALNRLRWTATLWLKRMSWPGVLGMSLIAFGFAFYFSSIVPAQSQLEQIRQEAATLHERIQHAASTFTDHPRSPGEQLGAFYGFFPAARSVPQWLDRIYRAAKIHGIVLEQGEYHLAAEREGRLLHYQVTLPVKGPYLQVRKFIATVLAEVPVVALDQVSFEKQKIGEPAVAAKIRFTLYLRKDA